MEILRKCQLCGKDFVAHRRGTSYCSPACQHKAMRRVDPDEDAREYIPNKCEEIAGGLPRNTPLFLSPNKLAETLGVSRSTIYRYLADGKVRCLQLKRITRIRKQDVDAAFEEAPDYKKRRYIIRSESNYYTMSDIVEKFHISRKAALSRCERFSIPKVYKGRNTYFSKAAVDAKFADLIEEINVENYYTTDELMAKYSMSRNAVVNFVSRHKVPRVTRLGKVLYSKVHIDTLKIRLEGLDPEYYSYAEIADRYGIQRKVLLGYIKKHGIRTEKRGPATMVHRVDFDKFLKEHKDGGTTLLAKKKDKKPDLPEGKRLTTGYVPVPTPDGYYSCADIADKYNMSVCAVQNLVVEFGLPRISIKNTFFYEKEAVESKFEENPEHANIKKWITGKGIDKWLSMSEAARRAFICRHKIPSKIVAGVAYYSKDHIEFAKGISFEGRENYYSSAEVMEKYGISIDLLCYYAKQNGFQKTKCGKYTYYLKEDVDIAMIERSADAVALEEKREEHRQYEEDLADGLVKKYTAQPIPSPEGYYSVAEVCEKYHITYDILKNVVKQHGIPSIKEKRFSFFPQEPLDKILSVRNVEIDRNEWLTGEEVDDLYEFKTVASRAAFLTRHAIPSTMSCNKTYYSKKALDQAKLHTFEGREDYYSKDEAMSKFGMSGDNLFHFAKRNKISTTRQGRAVFYLRADMDKAMTERMARMDKAVPAGYYSIDQISANYCIPHKQVQHTAAAQKIPFIVVCGVTYYDKAASDRVFSQEQRQYEIIDWLSAEEVDERYGFPAPQHRYSFIKTHQIPFIVKDDKKYYSKQHLDEAKYHSFDGREQYYTIKEITEKYSIEKKTADYLTRHYKVRKKSHGKLNFYLIEDVEKVMAEWTNDNK